MRYLLWILGLFGFAAALAIVSKNPAYIQLVYPPYRVELSLTVFVVLILLAFVLGYWLVRLVNAFVSLPDQVRRFRLERAQSKARKLSDEMFGAYFEGRYADAEKAADRAIRSGRGTALHSIVAARAAHELHDIGKRDGYLADIAARDAGDSTLRLMAATKFRLDAHEPEAALKTLQELHDKGISKHPGMLTLELKAQQQAGDWDQVLDVLDRLKKLRAIDPADMARYRQQAWMSKISLQQDLPGLTACLKTVPADIKRLGKFVALAAQALIRHGGSDQARKLLTDSLNSEWDGDLVSLFGDCQSSDTVSQIEQAEKWLEFHKQEPGLLLALGKLCTYQKLWGKAQSYLEASISLKPSREGFEALGRLAELLGKPDDAARHYQMARDVH
jgi:HemY protein